MQNVSRRVFWILAFVCSLSGCICVILKTYDKWQETPVIVSYSERYTQIFEIPFPAVTICPENSYSLIDPNYLWSLNESEKPILEPHVTNKPVDIANRFPNCIFNNERISCSKIFSEIRTDVGYCHTFNMLSHSELMRNEV
jgi:acid-sensing ion channel, other